MADGTMVRSHTCPVCVEDVADLQDNLLYEGLYQAWYHRRQCVSVSVSRYALLSKSSDPFFCSECYACCQAEEMSALWDELATLKNEDCELKKALQEETKSSTAQEKPVTTKDSQLCSYSAAVNNCPGSQGYVQTNIPHNSNSGWTTSH